MPGTAAGIADLSYLPKSWTDDRDRCCQAGIGDDVEFATRPELARQMIERAVTAGVPFAWAAGDEVYGGNPKLRSWLEGADQVRAGGAPCDEMTATAAGSRRAGRLAVLVPRRAWQQLSCADGSKGPRGLLSYPDLVEEFRNFVGWIADAGLQIRIGIDELDKLDSFLDEVVWISGLTVEQSMRLLSSSGNYDFPLSFGALCHCLSGGLPRELLRVARRVVRYNARIGSDPQYGRMKPLCERLVADDLEAPSLVADLAVAPFQAGGAASPDHRLAAVSTTSWR